MRVSAVASRRPRLATCGNGNTPLRTRPLAEEAGRNRVQNLGRPGAVAGTTGEEEPIREASLAFWFPATILPQSCGPLPSSRRS
eukprot:scaffold245_cov256-Pinguiococcus_pyrenoidosus.AAC.15